MKTDRRENVKVYCYKLKGKIYIINYNYLSEYVSFGLSSVVSKVFVADIEHVFFAGKDIAQKLLLF